MLERLLLTWLSRERLPAGVGLYSADPPTPGNSNALWNDIVTSRVCHNRISLYLNSAGFASTSCLYSISFLSV
jgi:hypothetical protein